MIIVKFDPITNRVSSFSRTGEASPATDTLVFHDQNSTPAQINALFNLSDTVPLKYMKHSGGEILEMTSEEKATIDAEIAATAALAIRNGAKQHIVGFIELPLFHRAISDIIRDELNVVRKWTRDFKIEVAAATNLANLQARVATLPTLADRTLDQLKVAIRNRVDDATVDGD